MSKSRPKSVIKVVDLDLIDVPESRLRAYQDEQSSTSLEGSLSRFGLIQEIGVREKPDGRYELIYGESRLRYLKAQGYKKYRVKVWYVDPKEAFLIMCAENLARGRPDAREILNAVRTMIEEYGYDVEEIRRITGLSRETIKRYAEISQFPDEVIDLILSGLLSVSVAYELRSLPPQAQVRYAEEAVRSGWTVDFARRVVQQYHTYMEELKKKGSITKEQTKKILEEALVFRCRRCGKKVDPRFIEAIDCCPDCKSKIEKLITIAELKCKKAWGEITLSDIITSLS